ncbi:MAG TPA: thymidine phosphorylase [Candidatus Marinimicrobia bacterium]|nr:thymidine phosphorylase [Candidatus Neomarinimicrobiota bacterium]
MIPTDFIEKKKNGQEHSSAEIKDFIGAYVKGDIPDYQMAAWLMAVNFQGMTDRETIALVDVMLHSGETIDLSHVESFKVDKHSTGGVGDKVSLILAPLANAVGCVVPMLSGRSLGHSGGTLDKLESIPGFNVMLAKKEFIRLVEKYGLAMGGQTEEVVPADRKMYALRDVTSTVKSIPLICGSILSKKIAEGIDGLVMDVKTGNGAFLPEYNQSQRLAKQLKNVGQQFGLKVISVITDMNQPLGNAVGNWLEVVESINTLKGDGPADLLEVTLHLTAWMVVLSGIEKDFDKAVHLLEKTIQSGAAYEKFLMMVENQGGDVDLVQHPEKYKRAAVIAPVISNHSGYIKAIDSYSIGMTALSIGTGRKNLQDVIKPEVGIIIEKKIGAAVNRAEPLAVIHAPDQSSWEQAQIQILNAFKITDSKVAPPPLFYETF